MMPIHFKLPKINLRSKPADDVLYEQFEDIPQQQESYLVGMWTFLVTEVMFFGMLFLCYTLYRWQYQPYFYSIHKELNMWLGAANTANLLFSSFTMALAVHFAQKKEKLKQLLCLGATLTCAFIFLGIKFVEYSAKIEHHLLPGKNFHWSGDPAIPSGVAQLFFSLYFSMTGLHGIHVIIGIICISTLMFLVATDHPVITDYVPTEMIGLYWHFVDLVWIFLFPLFYLMAA